MDKNNFKGGISQAIGYQFEKFINARIRGLEKINSGGRNPDFYCEEGNFWIEAKVGNHRWGPRIKKYQIENFSDITEPVIYALGFHDFNNAQAILKGKTPGRMRQILGRHMGIMKVNFVSGDLVKKLWKLDHRISEKEGTEYFMAKQSVFHNIWDRRPFSRFKKRIPSAEKYYGFSWDDFHMRKWDTDKCIMTPKNEVINYGFMIHREDENNAIKYFEMEGVL